MAKEFVHFSDGEKAVCGIKDAKAVAVTDEQQVTCKKCKVLVAQKAKQEGDPLIKVRVKNLDIPDGADFAFSFGYTDDTKKQMKGYRLINNAPHMLPKSVVEHLRKIAYPYKSYVPGQESGHAMQVAGKRYRFAITELDN